MRIVIKLLLILSAIYLIAFGFLYSFQESLIFQADTLEQDYQFQFDTPFEEKTIKTTDGAQLNGLHFKSTDPHGLVLYFHGNAGDLSRWGEIVETFVEQGYDVLVMDYRGYGKSTGNRKQSLMYADALLWYELALQDFDAQSISVYGRSLGCTFASYVASKQKPYQLILETPFYSLRSLVKNTYAIFPVSQLLQFKFPSHQFIKEVECPITIIHGTEDDIIPIENSRRLIELNSHIHFVTIQGGEHNDLADFDEYWAVIDTLLP